MHVAKLPNGRWRVIVQHDGQRRSAVADKRGTALQMGAELLMEMGGTLDPQTITVAELLATHTADADYSATYRAEVERTVDNLPAGFTARPVQSVTPVIIDALYRQLGREEWGPHAIRRIHAVLGTAFKRARRYGWVTSIPTRDAPVPRAPSREDTTPDTEQVRALLAATDDTAMHLAVVLAATLGLRREEVVGLQWTDIDRKAGTLEVARAVTYTPASGLVVGEPKTKQSRRTVSTPAGVLAALDAHRRAQTVIGVWVFTRDGMTPWRPDFLTKRFAALADEAGCPTVRYHDLRHFVATTLVGSGVDLRTVADTLGHAKVSFTLERYAASVGDRQRSALDGLDAALAVRRTP